MKTAANFILAILVIQIPLLIGLFYSRIYEANSQYDTIFILVTLAFYSIVILPRLLFRFWALRVFTILAYFLISIEVFLIAMHWHLYHQVINASTMFIILETNSAESMEFIKFYFDDFIWSLAILLVIISVPALWLFDKLVPKLKNVSFQVRLAILIPVTFILISSIDYFDLEEHTVLGYASKGYRDYIEESKKYEDTGFDLPIGNIGTVQHQANEKKEVFVIVIGESTASKHMSLYGYSRPTNPNLEAISDSTNQLVVYDNVISPHTHTIPSLSKILTPGNHESTSDTYQGSLIQLFNAAEFKTYWLSNQRPMGRFENLITKIAKASDETVFINTSHNSRRTPYDGELIPHFQRVVKDTHTRKAIFIHLLGTHATYKNRYPKRFHVFNSLDTSIQLMNQSQKALKTVNEYDNSVLYNDFLLNQMINSLEEIAASSYLIYFSDHGEDIYDDSDCACHTESKGTETMYRVPFLLWMNARFSAPLDFQIKSSRPYMMDDLFHSIAHLSGFQSSLVEEEQSIFSDRFEPRLRYITHNKTFDEKFAQ